MLVMCESRVLSKYCMWLRVCDVLVCACQSEFLAVVIQDCIRRCVTYVCVCVCVFIEDFSQTWLRKCREPVTVMAADSPLPFKAFEGKEEGDDEVLPGWLMIRADGRVERMSERLPASSTFDNGTASKDVVIDPELGSWARIFVPEVIASENTKKLPVVVYFHGGGFCLGDVGE